MTPVDLDAKHLKRILGWYVLAFAESKRQPDKEDTKLENRIRVMYEAEKEWDDAEKEDD